MFFTIKFYLHLNCVLMLNWIIWNWTVFDIETVLTLNWIVIYNCLNKLNRLKNKCFWQTVYTFLNELFEIELIWTWYAIKPNQTQPNHRLSLSSISQSWSSWPYFVSAQNWSMEVFTGLPTLVCPCARVYKKTSFIGSPLQCPVYLYLDSLWELIFLLLD